MKTDFTDEEIDRDKTLSIDNLGRDNFLQPMLLDKYGSILSHKTRVRDDLRSLLQATKADICLDVKANPKKYKIEKLIASDHKTIQWACDADEEVIELQEKLNQAEEEVNRANYAYWAIKDKGTRLDRAVTLYVTGYWGELSQIPGEMQAAIDAYTMKTEMSESLTTKLATKLKRRKENGSKKK